MHMIKKTPNSNISVFILDCSATPDERSKCLSSFYESFYGADFKGGIRHGYSNTIEISLSL